VLRLIASTLHESLQDEIFFFIHKELVDIAADKDILEIVSKVNSCRHAKVILNYTNRVAAKKSPDSQLRFLERAIPLFVIKIAYS
jgi:hypothetical protein